MLNKNILIHLIIVLTVFFYSCKKEVILEYKTMIDTEIIDLRLHKIGNTRTSNILLYGLVCSTDSINYYDLNLGIDLTKINNEPINSTKIKEEIGYLSTHYTRSYYLLKNDTLFYLRNRFLSKKRNSNLSFFQNRVIEPIASYRKSDSLYFYFTPLNNSKIHIKKSQEMVQTVMGSSYSYVSTKRHIKLNNVNFYQNSSNSPDADVSDILNDFRPKSIEIDNYNGLKYKYMESYYSHNEYNSKDQHMVFFNDKNIILNNR